MQKADIKTLVISVWLGKWPAFFPFFLQSISRSTSFKFLLFSNQKCHPKLPDNAEIRHFTLEQINELASERLGFKTDISLPLKLCDFKPAFGKIFEHFLEGYNYWGYCDIDLILGNLSKFILPFYADALDVISFYRGFMSGPFCLFRNAEKTLNLYSKVSSHRTVLQSPEHNAFDENIPTRSSDVARTRKAGLKIRYLTGLPFYPGRERFRSAEIAYQFQWYLKKRTLEIGQPADMTELVLLEERKGSLSPRFADLLKSDREFRRMGREKWHLKWENGTLWDADRNRELFGFHFVDLKNSQGFNIPSSDRIPGLFRLTQNGFEL
jgi:hypothetical protein